MAYRVNKQKLIKCATLFVLHFQLYESNKNGYHIKYRKSNKQLPRYGQNCFLDKTGKHPTKKKLEKSLPEREGQN